MYFIQKKGVILMDELNNENNIPNLSNSNASNSPYGNDPYGQNP